MRVTRKRKERERGIYFDDGRNCQLEKTRRVILEIRISDLVSQAEKRPFRISHVGYCVR